MLWIREECFVPSGDFQVVCKSELHYKSSDVVCQELVSPEHAVFIGQVNRDGMGRSEVVVVNPPGLGQW